MNKYTENVPEAIHRVQGVAAPANGCRLGIQTPCAIKGVCGDCHSTQTMCGNIVITRNNKLPGRVTVVMVGEELGF
jgi:hypothetical protein